MAQLEATLPGADRPPESMARLWGTGSQQASWREWVGGCHRREVTVAEAMDEPHGSPVDVSTTPPPYFVLPEAQFTVLQGKGGLGEPRGEGEGEPRQ